MSDQIACKISHLRRTYMWVNESIAPASYRMISMLNALKKKEVSRNVAEHIEITVKAMQGKRRKRPEDDSEEESAENLSESMDFALEQEFYAWCVETLKNKPTFITCMLSAIHDAVAVTMFYNADCDCDSKPAEVMAFEDYPEMSTIFLLHVMKATPISQEMIGLVRAIVKNASLNPNDYDTGTVPKTCKPAFAAFFTRLSIDAELVLANLYK